MSTLWSLLFVCAVLAPGGVYADDITAHEEPRAVEQLRWRQNEEINLTIGPDDATFCRIADPRGNVVFEGFRRCSLAVPRVTPQHAGTWSMTVTRDGRILSETSEFAVELTTGTKAQVVTSVITEKPIVTLSCNVASAEPITGCKFRNPAGRILVASGGVVEDRYTFQGVGVNMQAFSADHQCGLRITDPAVADLGLWRCAMESETDTYFGFLTVLCPFAMSVPGIAEQVQAEPVLTAVSNSIHAVERSSVTMQCSINSAIRYCYFRRQNGTIFSVAPGMSGAFEYVGAGLDAGECGIRFSSLTAPDAGTWACHVGFNNPNVEEQRDSFFVDIEAEMVAEQFQEQNGHNTLVVRSQVHGNQPLDYCRFVRMDGFGFTTENMPEGYRHNSNLNRGNCELLINFPSILERHPWAVVVRIRGQTAEIQRNTVHSLSPGTTAPPPPEPEATPGPGPVVIIPGNNSGMIWAVAVLAALLTFFVGLTIGSRSSRKWISEHFRSSFRKHPKVPAEVIHSPHHQNSPIAA